MRGERNTIRNNVIRDNGSSPHARGTHEETMSDLIKTRFIPACAGNALMSRISMCWPAVHPRMRGEREFLERVAFVAAGSSPHARGTPENGQHACQDERFIPACAGNAFAKSIRSDSINGSSPHARGTPMRSQGQAVVHRFIPACAGNAGHSSRRGDSRPVHPRMRGERNHT